MTTPPIPRPEFVERFRMYTDRYDCSNMHRCHDGEYVLYSDYEAMVARLTAEVAAVREGLTSGR